MNFLYCIDENYNTQTLTSIKALSNTVSKEVNIYIIHKQPETFFAYKDKILKMKNIKNIFVYEFKMPSNMIFPEVNGKHVSEATYYRFFVADYVRDQDSIVYIDSDIICLNDPIDEIQKNIDKMKKMNYFICAKTDSTRANSEDLLNRLNMKNDSYFNAGVLLINLNLWRESNLKDLLINKMIEIQNKIIYWDQDVLNSLIDGRYIDISKKLNFTLFEGKNAEEPEANFHDKDFVNYLENIRKDIFMVHYAGKFKPWSLLGVLHPNSIFYQENYKQLGLGDIHVETNSYRILFKNLIFALFNIDIFSSRYKLLFIFKLLKNLFNIKNIKSINI